VSFKNKSTVIYRVRIADGGKSIGAVSVRTDRKNKSGRWTVSNRAIADALADGDYISDTKDVGIEGDDDGVLFVYSRYDDELQLEYVKHHDIAETKGFFGEPEISKENPVSSLSTGQWIAIAVGGALVLGGAGYLLYTKYGPQTQPALAPTLPTTTSPPALPPISGTTDQVPPFVPGIVDNQ